MEKQNNVSELLTTEEVAELLRVKVRWVYTQSRLGKIPHMKLGNHIRFQKDVVLKHYGYINGNGTQH